jgi:membrane associated rhomboid family serine protease
MNIIDDLKLQYRIGGITNKLIYWNVGIFIISLPVFFQFKTGEFDYPAWLYLSSSPNDLLVFPWTLLTYAFLHFTFFHLFFNMLLLLFAGRLFLTFFTERQLFGLYILSAVFAGSVFVISYYLMEDDSGIVGASAAIMAILMAVTTYRPLMHVRLLLLGNVKLWYITAVIVLLDMMQIQLENTGGHIAHLAGAFFGFTYIKFLQNGTDMSKLITGMSDFFVNLFQPRKTSPFKKVHKNYKPTFQKSVSKIVTKDKAQQQIDEILDKISQSGYDSLTKEEKEFLFKAGK